MPENLIQVKAYLGKYYSELNYSAIQEKYSNTRLDTIFDQRFHIQGNKAQMVVDPSITGLCATISGNEVHISKELYDHPSVIISNSLEQHDPLSAPRSLYNPETFSTMAYLVCQNQTMFYIVGEVDEPIYLKYHSDYETFYNSVIVVEVAPGVEVEIVEEVESFCALNAVVNYIVGPTATLNLRTFYSNRVSGISFFYRNIVAQEDSTISHVLCGKGSSNAIDEIRLKSHQHSSAEFLGIVNSAGKDFHSILYVQPVGTRYSVNVDYRDMLSGAADVTFFPVVQGEDPGDKATISVSNITLDVIDENSAQALAEYIQDVVDRCILTRMTGIKRFYDKKTEFLVFP
jgi:hypothetical protein